MIKLLKKEISLTYLPVVWFFPFLGALLLIPHYPYCVGVSYAILSIFISFSNAAENRDGEYTLALPIKRVDIVKGKMASGVFLQLLQIIIALIAGCIASFVLWGENTVGLDANFTFYGFVFLGYAIFNIIFFPMYFGRGCRVGWAVVIGVIAYLIFVALEEIIVGVVPAVHKVLDGFSSEYIGARIAVLCFGIVAYIGSIFGSYYLSVKKFERVSM